MSVQYNTSLSPSLPKTPDKNKTKQKQEKNFNTVSPHNRTVWIVLCLFISAVSTHFRLKFLQAA